MFQVQYEEWHALPRGDRTLANAWIWWGMKTHLKRKIGAVTGEMGRGQHYRGNAADQIQHQTKYFTALSLVTHTKTQSTVIGE